MEKLFVFALTFLLLTLDPCFADWFDGEVQKIDLEAQELTVSEIDPITEVEEAEVISIVPQTTFAGVKALKDIRTGDEVAIEAKYDEPSDSWQAVSVEIPGAGE